MQRILIATTAAVALALLAGCNQPQGTKPTGTACLGQSNDSLVEHMADQCQAGDAVATKFPAYFCDFTHAVAYNGFNSALCIYTGKQAEERIKAAPAVNPGK